MGEAWTSELRARSCSCERMSSWISTGNPSSSESQLSDALVSSIGFVRGGLVRSQTSPGFSASSVRSGLEPDGGRNRTTFISALLLD